MGRDAVRAIVRSPLAPKSGPSSSTGLPKIRQIRTSPVEHYWAIDPLELIRRLQTTENGLSQVEAFGRLERYGRNELLEQRHLSRLAVLWRQLQSPLLLLLLFAAFASGLSGEWIDAAIVMTIVIATVLIGFSREYSAQSAAAALRARLRTVCTVIRDGGTRQVANEEVVPGDVVMLAAGSLVPADAIVLEAIDFFVNQAVLTGESFPVQKTPGVRSGTATTLNERTACVFLGSNVRSGTARCLVVATGPATEFGAIAHRLALRPPETEFDRGIRRFGYLLTSAMLIMVLLVFVAHVFMGRPPVETLLFAVALAVGLSPELLPAILSVNLARAAEMMARRGVLVRRLNAIENLGSMNVLCTDKTGTLTEGVVRIEGAYDFRGMRSDVVLELAACNAALETGTASPLDQAITDARRADLTLVRKLAEIPFDFVRKRVTVAVQDPQGIRLITKGAFHHVLETCTRTSDGTLLDDALGQALEREYDAWTSRGIRVLAVATRTIQAKERYGRDDEREMTFAGFLTFLDQPKEGVANAIGGLAALGVSVKVITGDSRLVAQHVASLVGLRCERVLTGHDLDELHDDALWLAADQTDLYVEVDPNP